MQVKTLGECLHFPSHRMITIYRGLLHMCNSEKTKQKKAE